MASIPAELTEYRLLELAKHAPSAITRDVLEWWQHRLGLAYRPDQVDWQIGEGCVLLCPETEAYLYSDFTPTALAYQPGDRPELEQILNDVIAIGQYTSQRDKAVAIMRYARDIWLEREGADVMNAAFHGGTEEQIIAKQSKLCNELARVLIVLAQIAGLPARYLGHIPGDHGVAEVYIDGQWAYFDVRGQHFERPDGRLASFVELRANPQWIDQQQARLQSDLATGYTLNGTREFVSPGCMTFIGNYAVWQADRYGYDPIPNTPELAAKIEATNERWAQLKQQHLAEAPSIN